MISQLTIVIIAYNRSEALKRLLGSISLTKLKDYNLNFIFSLEKKATKAVIKVINDFELNRINKVIIHNDNFLGADRHNLKVQQLALIHENILILEDDHFVSPYLFDFAFAALNFYQKNENVAAISLYPYSWVESISVPFLPLEDGYFNYFQQRPSSRGYILTKNQVIRFNEWKINNPSCKNQLPPNTKKWKSDNWEKMWYNYLIDTNQFLVFPHVAFNTVFGELGYNMKNSNERYAFQQPLAFGKSIYNFSTSEHSYSVYDAFYEYLKYEELGFEDVEGNLYGTKTIDCISKKFIAINTCNDSSIKSFGRDLKPIELNVLLNNHGNEISIIETKNYRKNNINNLENYLYFKNLFAFPTLSVFFKYCLRRIKQKIMKL